MINRLISSPVPRLITSAIGNVNAVSRYFTTFDSVANMYGEFSSSVTLSGDFRIEFDFSVPVGSNSAFLGGVGDFNNRIFINNSEVNGVVGGASLFNGRVAVNDSSDLNHVVIERTDVAITITVNGVKGAVINSANTFVLNYIGRVNTTYSQGFIANLQIEDNGTLVVDMPIDGSDYFANPIIKNNAAVLGGEFTTPLNSGDYIQQGGSTVTPTSATSFNSSTSGSGLRKIETLNIGTSYLVDVYGLSNCEVWFGLSGSSAFKITVDGTYLITITADTDDLYFRAPFSGDSSFNSVSVKEIPSNTPLATMYNASDGDTESFTFDSDYGWVGEERWLDGLITSLAPATTIFDNPYPAGKVIISGLPSTDLKFNDGSASGFILDNGIQTVVVNDHRLRNTSATETYTDFIPSIKPLLELPL